jgi:hypothetical protein
LQPATTEQKLKEFNLFQREGIESAAATSVVEGI